MKRFVLLITLSTLAACGGGQNSGGPPPPASIKITPQTAELYTLTTQQFNASVSGVSWSASTGSIDQNGLYTAPAVIDNFGIPVTITATARGASGTASLRLLAGNGSLKYTFDPSVDAPTQAQFPLTEPVQAETCGAASDNATVTVVVGGVTSGGLFRGGASPSILIAPSSAGQVGLIAHETTHALWNSILSAVPFEPLVEGFPMICGQIVVNRLVQSGLTPGPERLDYVHHTDTVYSSWTADQAYLRYPMTGDVGHEVLSTFVTAIAPTGTRAGDWAKYSISSLNDAILEAFNKGAFDTSAWLAAIDKAATVNGTLRLIDNQRPSEWVSRFPAMTEWRLSGKTTFATMTLWSDVRPSAFLAKLGTPSSPIGDVPVAISIKDVNQQEVLTVNGTTSKDNVGFITSPSLGTLPSGAYTYTAQASLDGTTYTEKHVFVIVPREYSDFRNPPGLFLVTVDTDGNAIGGSLGVTDGTIIDHWPGVIIVDANPPNVIPASITVKTADDVSHTFTQPRPWTRVIPIVAQ
jgi:hypothetical protein